MGLPRYLKKKREERLKRKATFRLRNEIRKKRYWEGIENRKFRFCEWEEETCEYMITKCMGEGKGKKWESGKEKILRILKNDRSGEG